MKSHTIDATGKSLGRIASEVAILLMGKDEPDFVRHKPGDASVEIVHASKLKVTGAKMEDKRYLRYTGYPGGQRALTMRQLIDKKGYGEALIKAVRGMLPANKLRPIMLKRLLVKE